MTSTATVENVKKCQTVRKPNTLKDRCDVGQCGAQAFMIAERIVMDEDGELVVTDLHFCGHHGTKSKATLEAQGFDIIDNTGDINKTPSISANAL